MNKLIKPFNIPSHKREEIKDLVNELGKIPFGSLIGNILSSCVDAQTHAAFTAWNYTQKVLEHKDPIVFNFQDEEGMKSLSVPLLTIVPLPYLKLDNIDINLEAEVSINQEKRKNEFLITVNNKTKNSTNTNVVQGNANMQIDINAGTTDMPTGLSMLLQYMGGGLVVKDKIRPKVGEVYTGKIVEIQDFKAIVELPISAKGELECEEIDWDWRRCKTMRYTNLKEGDDIEVKIKKIDEKTDTICLTHRELVDKPEDYKPNPPIKKDNIYHGRIDSISSKNKYAVVEIIPDKRGKLSISEVDWKEYKTMEETWLEPGSDIDVKLIEIKKNGELSLSHKALLDKPEEPSNPTPEPSTPEPSTPDTPTSEFKVGEVYRGVVSSFSNTEAMLKINNIDGRLSVDDYDWNGCKSMQETGIKVGDEIVVEIIDIVSGQLKLSRRTLLPKPNIKKTPKEGEVYNGVITFIKEPSYAEVKISPSNKVGKLSITEIDWNWKNFKTIKDMGFNNNDKIVVKLTQIVTSIDKQTNKQTQNYRLSRKVLLPKS